MSDLTADTVHDGDEFQARLDELLDSALKDQAREKRVLIETVQGAKSALTRAQEELTALRLMVDKRDTAVVDMLEARLSGLGTESTMEEIEAKVDALLGKPSAGEAVAPVSVRIDSLAARIDEVAETLKRLDVWAPVSEVQKTMTAKIAELIMPVAQAVEAADDHVIGLTQRTERSIDALGTETARRLDEAHRATGSEIARVREAVEEMVASRLAELTGQTAGGFEDVRTTTLQGFSEVVSQLSERMTDLDAAIARRLDAIDDDIVSRAERTAAQVNESAESITNSIRSRIGALEEAVAGDVDVSQDAVVEHVTVAAQVLRDHLAETMSRVEERMARLREATADSREHTTSAVASVSEEISDAMARVVSGYEETSERTVAMIQSSDARVFDRLQKVVEEFAALNGRVTEVVAEIDERLEEARNSQEIRNSVLAKHVESIRETVASGEQVRNDNFARNVLEITQTFSEERNRITHSIGEALAPFIMEMGRLGERVRQTNRRILESNTRLEAFQESVIAYLAERDQRLEEVRDRVIIDLIEQVGEGLRAGERRRLADAWKEAQIRRADRRDAEKYRKMKNHPSVKEPAVEDVREALQLAPPKLASVTASELLAEVEAEMPSMDDSVMAEPEKELLVERPTPKSAPKPRAEKSKQKTTVAKPPAKKTSSGSRSKTTQGRVKKEPPSPDGSASGAPRRAGRKRAV